MLNAKPSNKPTDFEKKKIKLGKKSKPNNATDVSFKTRGKQIELDLIEFLNNRRVQKQTKAVNVPQQSIGEEKDDVVSTRNLTIRELLSQTNHYNENVRKGTTFFCFCRLHRK